jgi:hypothetical protein
MLHHALDDEVLVSILRSISRHLEVWVSLMRVEKIVEVLLETYRRLKEQTRKSPKPILALLQEASHYCILPPYLKESIEAELHEARKVSHLSVTVTESHNHLAPSLRLVFTFACPTYPPIHPRRP